MQPLKTESLFSLVHLKRSTNADCYENFPHLIIMRGESFANLRSNSKSNWYLPSILHLIFRAFFQKSNALRLNSPKNECYPEILENLPRRPDYSLFKKKRKNVPRYYEKG